ncbi:Vegetative incompatibility protein HET-E-1 [Fusarium oxysporum f. sp. rapae]|uniref:Vegetative incompatibility protein HET-E-1 n=1 Tax=Fusarium oxysporum f. sp. rapae TaxID=485398 RepID=A0A8J5NVU6_FUSOX|nr:Vegetative incompatibility protein HET-E-1 [Fusarium oxysporum f. sp. rapae]
MRHRLKSPDLYTIGWIAALPIERAAATALLDERHDVPEGFHQHRSDANSYTWGRIGEHNIVIASLPAGVYGTTSTANTAADLIHSLPHIRIGLLVGIGGGIARPDLGQDIRLGDIVVSQPDGTTGGVVQYDLGKAKANGVWERKGSLYKPPPVLLHALASLQAEHEIVPPKVPDLLQAMWEANPHMRRQKNGYTYQGAENDRLFESHRDHDGGSTCDKCDSAWEVKRDRRESTDPEIHYGVIASGNKLIKDAATRDSLSEDTGHQCLCVEMEAAGLMDRFPCLVIRGICDYADSHKNDRWQRYAAAAAAAFAVELLGFVPAGQLESTQKIIEIMQSLEKKVTILSTLIQNVDYNIALDKLPVAHGASFDSHAEEHHPTCLPDTREELLKEIDGWIDDPKSKTIFWLNGMAGTGKSTISRTVARARAKRGDLGASFFFKRGEVDRDNLNKLMPTLAYQLALSMPEVSFFIKKALDANSAVIGDFVKEQFEKLIQEPLSKAAATATTPSSVVMVINALDECDQEADIRLLINIFSLAKTLRPRFRVFLTSRPELPIRLGFSEVQGSYQDLVLHDIPAQVVEHGIIVFLDDKFKKIRHDFNMTVGDERKLPQDWPGCPIVQSLARMAVPLFIFAATVCRFIGDRKRDSPPMQLHKVLDYEIKGHVSQLGRTYGPVLCSLITDVSENDKTQIINDFKMIVGSIVILANPLSVWALSQLLEVDPEVVDNRLDTLHSVLSIPSTRKAPVRLLHLSFRDYLLTNESELRVDERHTHQTLAKHCLRVMRGGLRENICGLSFPGTRRSTVDSSELEERIPPHLQYACMHWVYHQIEGYPKLNDDNKVYDFLTTHFLHWLELMSLMGRSTKSLRMLKSFRDWLQHDQSPNLSSFVADAVRFVQTNFSVIDEAPLQLYSSALVFSPSNSVVGGLFKIRIPKWLSLWPHVEENWDACLSTLEGHSDVVYSVVFSHDSKVVASASGDKTVRLWSVEMGECKHVLEGHGSSVLSVVFSHDSKAVASGSGDNTVRLWSVETGECEHVLEGHNDVVNPVFSHDSKVVASAAWDNTVRLWSAETGKCEHVLEGHGSSVFSVVFSHDSKVVASASFDKTIRLWSVEAGECEHVLEGHGDSVVSVVFSHDSKVVASGSDGGAVRLWSVETGQCARVIQHTSRTWEFYVEASRM